MPRARGGRQADVPGLEDDPREVAPAGPALGLDKAVMLGYHRVQNDSLVCLDLSVPNCSSQTDTNASSLEGRTTGWIKASRIAGSLNSAAWEPVRPTAGTDKRRKGHQVFLPREES